MSPDASPDALQTALHRLSALATSRISLTAHTLSPTLPPATVRHLTSLTSLATLFTHHATSRVVLASYLLPDSLTIYFTSSTPLSQQARAAINNVPIVAAAEEWTREQKIDILSLGVKGLKDTAKKVIDGFATYRKLAPREARVKLVELVGERKVREHAELAVAEYLFQRGAGRVDLGVPEKRGVCFACEMWFKAVMERWEVLRVRCWEQSGVCEVDWRMPRWRVEGEGGMEVEERVRELLEEYVGLAERMLGVEDEEDEGDGEEE
ncbi:hypothetical protein EX30DRAFT_373163 [Ascodesmis nigricans]|uniref:Uncharacterized protein n=1 Tax=Ascodesmis nigricans TaxID=341454 RepID=A0A4S2MQQ1_9PEZI|nr:hypothetical protein EX30DRAFT_373163 [Ascodesmis nigricans]